MKVVQKALPAIDPADYPTHSQMFLEKRRRTVIVAGSQKCGTSALAAYLSSHPSIRFSKMKEVHHFDQNLNFKRGLKKYDAQWPLGPEDPDFEAQVEELGDLEEVRVCLLARSSLKRRLYLILVYMAVTSHCYTILTRRFAPRLTLLLLRLASLVAANSEIWCQG